MDSNMYTQWVQSPIQDSVPNEPNDSNNPSPSTLDISEFAMNAELPASASSLLSTTTNQSFYPSYGAYYMPQPSYTTMPYGTQWQASVPLSNYSSLNGATTSSSSQHQSPQQQPATTHLQQHVQLQPVPSTSQNMIIDPALTMNGPSSNSMSPSFSHSPPFSPPPQHQQPQPQQVQPQSQAQQQQRTQFYSQHILYPSPYYRQQPQPPSQGTLSPQALHSPTSSMISLIPSQFYNPLPTQPLVQPSPSQQQQQPPPQQQQQPQARQSPSIPGPIASTSQIAPAPVSPVPNPSADERRRQFENSIRPLLQPNAFTGAQAVMQLTHFIVEYGPSEVDAAMRLEILARIRDGAGNQYFRAWSENSTAMDITREWIKASAKSNNAALVETTMPLLHLIDRLPITLQSLRASKLGKIIKKLVKDEPSPAIKDMASNLEQRWRTLLQNDTDGGAKASSASENKGNEDPKVKKRKLSEASSSSLSATNRQPAQPMKRVAVGSASATKPVAVKKEGKPLSSTSSSTTTTTTTTTAAAADSSFFSAPKPKAKLPSFKKAPISSSNSSNSLSSSSSQTKEDQPNNVALPSSSNPFQEILAAMNKRDSPSVSTPPSVSANNSSESQQQQQQQQTAGLARNGRKKKVVTWPPEDKLESIKLIERAVYDDDPVDGTHVAHSFRDLDRGEGAALHAPPMFEEMADWAEPMLLELPSESTDPSRVRGIQSEEKDTQAEREQTALSAMYLPNQIPDTPTEPGMVLLSEEEVDKDVTQMTAGPEVDAIFWSSDVGVVGGGEADQPMTGVVAGAGVGPTPSVADLVSQLAMGLDAASMGAVPNMGAVGPQQDAMATMQNLQSLPPEQLQQLLQQLQFAAYGGAGAGGVAGTGPTGGEAHGGGAWNAGTGGGSGNGNQYGMSDYGYHEDNNNNNANSSRNWSDGRGGGGGGRGFGGRGRGMGAGPGRGRGGGYGYGRGGGGGGDREEGFRTYIKRKPCSFFAAGRCKYGDQCDFAHDLSMLQQPEH